MVEKHEPSDLILSLFVGEDTESVKAEQVLKDSGFKFDVNRVRPNSVDLIEFDELPTLIGGRGHWIGLENIQSFVQELHARFN